MSMTTTISRLQRGLMSLGLLLLGSSSSAAAGKPNFIILLCDDLGYGDLNCYAHPKVRSPNIDRLAQQGVKLTSCYSASPVCSPSRAGLLTGRTPNRLGIRDWIPADSGIYLRPDEITIAQLLQNQGYRTCHAGKWHLNSKTDGSERTPGECGFDHWLYTQNNAAPSHLNPTNFIRNGQPVGQLAGASSHIVVEEAIQFLDTDRSKPFFLNIWFHEPHEPVAATKEFLKRYPDEQNIDKQQYYGDITQMDAAVGKLMRYLDEHGLRDNTVVVFTSDNGPETLNRYAKANRSYGSPGPLRGMKLHVTEAGYRVPGIIRWPGHIKPGSVSDTPVCSVDFLPTFCAIAAAKLPTNRVLDGTDISPLFDGKPLTRPHPLYWEYDYAISKPWTLSLREGAWKLLANANLDRFELYHLADNREANNLADQEPARVQEMLTAARQLQKQVRAEGAKSGNPAAKGAKK